MMIWAVEAQQWWYSETKVYRWRHGGLTEVPHDIPAETRKVDLEYNQIEVIRENTFTNLSVCEELWLSSNKIQTIETGAWNGLDSLTLLSLAENQIEVVRENTFTNLSVCEELWLGWNKIHTIEDGAWNGLDSLKQLSLRYNKIELLWPGMFSGLDNCTRLELNDNKIHTIHTRALDGLVSLTELRLYGNQLTTFPWTVFGKEHPAQHVLWLSENPLVCNSTLCWLKHADMQGWIGWWRPAHKPFCSDTDTDWDDITLPCSHLGLYRIILITSISIGLLE